MLLKFRIHGILMGIWVYLLWAGGGTVVAQEPVLKQLSDKDGLPSLEVYEIQQDSKGYFWICTESGVVRYDGYQCEFAPLGADIEHSDVFGIMEDSQGRIWFRTLNGRVCYYHEGNYFNPANDALCKALSFESMVLQIMEGSGGLYFLSNLNGIHVLEGESVTHYFPDYIRTGMTNEMGTYVVGSTGIYEQEPSGLFGCIETNLRNTRYCKSLQHQKDIYVSYGDVLVRFDSTFQRPDTILTSIVERGEIISLHALGKDTLVLGTRNGVVFWSISQATPVQYLLPGKSVSSFLKDRSGGYWYSTLGNGIYHEPFPGSKARIKWPDDIQGRVSCLHLDPQENLWIGGEHNQVWKWDGKELDQRVYYVENSSGKGHIRKIVDGVDGDIWVIGKKVLVWIHEDGHTEMDFWTGNTILVDDNGQIWLGGTHCYRFEAFEGRLHENLDMETHLPFRTTALAKTGDTLWIGSSQGLIYYLEETGFRYVPGLNQIPIGDIQMPYIMTKGGSLFRMSGQTARPLELYPPINARAYCMQEFNDELLIGTNEGLYRVKGQSSRFDDRLGKVRIYDLAPFKDTLFIGSDRGLISFPYQRSDLQPNTPALYLDSIKVNGNLVAPDELGSLAFNENNIQLFYTGLLFPRRPRYRYRLNQEDWFDAAFRQLTLKLSPGKYKVEVQALNEAGGASESIFLDISIALPIWEQPATIGLAILLVLAVIAWGTRRYLRKIRLDHQHQRELDQANLRVSESKNRVLELEQQALRLQMNPHFLFNSINSIKGLYAQGKVREAITFIHHFSKFLRVVVNNDSALIAIKDEVAFLDHYLSLEKMKFPSINFDITVGPDLDPERMNIPFMLVQPYAENAILHGLGPKKGPGHIRIHFERENAELVRVIIEDDGVGLSGKKITPKKTSMGMRITAERLALFNGAHAPGVQIHNRPDGPGVIVTFLTRFEYV